MPNGSHTPNGGALPIVNINGTDLSVIEVGRERVVTLAMIDRVHGRPEGPARKRFNDNRDRLVEGQHYAKLSASVFRTRFPGVVSARATEEVTVLTERGYLMLVKSFTDDLAWQVQDALVESYFTKPATAPSPRIAQADVSREYRLTMQQSVRWAKMAGLIGNQALLAANRATKALTGINTLGLLGISHMPAPASEVLLTPTDIGIRTGLGSARRVNLRLCEMGLQTCSYDHRGRTIYEPTDAGRAAGAIMQDTGKKHGSGTPVRQLKWNGSIVRQLQQDDLLARVE